jgi:hypothetical protein
MFQGYRASLKRRIADERSGVAPTLACSCLVCITWCRLGNVASTETPIPAKADVRASAPWSKPWSGGTPGRKSDFRSESLLCALGLAGIRAVFVETAVAQLRSLRVSQSQHGWLSWTWHNMVQRVSFDVRTPRHWIYTPRTAAPLLYLFYDYTILRCK